MVSYILISNCFGSIFVTDVRMITTPALSLDMISDLSLIFGKGLGTRSEVKMIGHLVDVVEGIGGKTATAMLAIPTPLSAGVARSHMAG